MDHFLARHNMLRGLAVKDAMRRQVIELPQHASIDKGINFLIKYKVSALLITTDDRKPIGVVSKTDIMSAYYAAMPVDAPLESIMSSPPLFCREDDSLESALDRMRSERVYRLYAHADDPEDIVGMLAYPDIVGLLYRYCHKCEYSLLRRGGRKLESTAVPRFLVKDVMTPKVEHFKEEDPLMTVMEGLSAYRFGAVLITAGDHRPVGVVSKTDLILAYKHGVGPYQEAGRIMSSPVLSCDQGEFLEEAIRLMIFSEVHRLFIHKDYSANIVGVFSLSDAARLRSGSCQACVSSRIKVEQAD